jgi:O-antigen/teichoic acid export membrane protein
VPVTGFRSSGIGELVQHGVSGLLAEERDEAALAANLLRLLEDETLAARLSSAARARVEEHFNLSVQTALLEQHYQDVTPCACARAAAPQEVPPAPYTERRLRRQATWMISGNGAAVLFQAAYFMLMGRMLGSREYGSFVGVVALVNVLSQFSSMGTEMLLVRNISRDRASFAVTWGKALLVSGAGFLLLLAVATGYGQLFLAPGLRLLVPWVAVSDALFGKVTQLASRALQGADLAADSAHLTAMTSVARASAAALLFLYVARAGVKGGSALEWVHVYWLASLAVAASAVLLVDRRLGPPRFTRIRLAELKDGLSFSLSSSATSVYNDIDKTMLVSVGQTAAAGIYGAAYRIVDVVTTPIYGLFAAATPRFFREGTRGVGHAAVLSRRMLRVTLPFGVSSAVLLWAVAPLLPLLFGRSFAGSVSALRWLCLLPLIRGLQYAWGTTITTASSQWLRTSTQAGAALLNLILNLFLIPRWSWEGAAAASLITDGGLALSNGLLVAWLVRREAPPPH